MKTPLLYLTLFFCIHLEANTFAQSPTNHCPKQLVVAIECTENNRDFQLLKHIGKYTEPKMEWHDQQMICSYGASEWISKYKFTDASGENIATVSSLRELSGISKLIRQKGFDVDPSSQISPFTMITYKQNENSFTPDQMFLFSGLESTFGKENLTVATNNNKFSTAVINDRYLKSQDAAADIYVTGSNCFILIK